jgi:uncharacterized protein YkwD
LTLQTGSSAVAQEVSPAAVTESVSDTARPATVENVDSTKTAGVASVESKEANKNAASENAPAKSEDTTNTAGADCAKGATETKTAVEKVYQHSVAMTELHNQYRSRIGLPAQTVDEDLSATAQRWANHMASVGSMYHGGGEQIIAYSSGDTSYSAGFGLWIGSSPHRAWLCSRGDRCGFGYAIGRNGAAYFAGAFGSSPKPRTVASSNDGQSSNFTSVSYSNNSRRRGFRRR